LAERDGPITPQQAAYFAAEWNTPDYQIDAINRFLLREPLAGKRVLEVGGSNLPRELVFGALGAAQWVCIDVIDDDHYALTEQSRHYSSERIRDGSDIGRELGSDGYQIFNAAIEDAADLPDGGFDAVVSITALEHIINLSPALRNCHRVLKPGGLFYSYHGPVWSGAYGHHIWVDRELNFTRPGSVPPFGHLLRSPPEMIAVLRPRFGQVRAEKAVYQMYHSERINRLFYEDYQQYFAGLPFVETIFEPYGTAVLRSDLERRLRRRWPRSAMFGAYGQTVFAKRAE
jgi:SAM-dependent methyltransferase